MKPWLSIVVTAVFLSVCSGGSAEDQVDPEAWMAARLREYAVDPLMRIPPEDHHDELCYQFEYRVISDFNRDQRTDLRWQIDNYHTYPTKQLVSADGIPRYWSGMAGTFIVDGSLGNNRGYWCEAKVPWDVETAREFLVAPDFRPERFSMRIDFRTLLIDLWNDRRPETVVYEGRTSMICWERTNDSQVEILFAREQRPQQFPLQQLRVHSRGKITAITNMVVLPGRHFPGNYAARCTSSRRLLEKEERKRYEEIPEEKLASTLQDSVRREVDRQHAATSVDSTETVARALWDQLAPRDRFTPEENQLIKTCLLNLDFLRGKPPVPSPDTRTQTPRKQVLDQLTDFIVRRVVEPIRVQTLRSIDPQEGDWRRPDSKRVATYLTGHERWRTVERLEAFAELGLPAAMYASLADVILDPSAAQEDRLAALDLLGEIGLPPLHPVLPKLDESLRRDEDPRIRALWAAAAARIGGIQEVDAALLRQMVKDGMMPHELRMICLEGLLLLGDTGGLEEFLYATVCGAGDDVRDMARRCLFAAGCSREGRAVLRRMLVDRRPEKLLRSALFLAETCIHPGDPEWEACLQVAEGIALDPQSSWELRVKASEIASSGDESRPFRDRFVRQVLLSGEAGSFYQSGWRYLPRQSGGQRFVVEFEQALQTGTAEQRRFAAYLLNLSCDKELSTAEEEQAILKLLRLIAVDDEAHGFPSATALYWKFRKPKTRCFVDELLPFFVKRIHEERDPERFADFVSNFANALDRSIQPHPKIDDKTHRLRTAEATRRLVEAHRAEYEAMVDQWAAEGMGYK